MKTLVWNYTNQIRKYKYNGDNTELLCNYITTNNMTLTKSSYFDVVEPMVEH